MNSIEKTEELVKDLAKTEREVSHIAVRHDGVILVSLEDAEGCDLTRRKVVSYLVLTEEEASHLRSAAEEGAYGATAAIFANLSKAAVDA